MLTSKGSTPISRIRNLTVAGALAGATVLGGTGLAGAADGDTEAPDPAVTQLQEDVPEQSTTDRTTGEPEAPVAPTLPEQAGDRARTALGDAPAFGDRTAADGVAETEAPATEGAAAETEHEDHGQHVSETARSTPAGPGHGEAVSEVARQHGQSHTADDDADDDADAEDDAEDLDDTDDTDSTDASTESAS